MSNKFKTHKLSLSTRRNFGYIICVLVPLMLWSSVGEASSPGYQWQLTLSGWVSGWQSTADATCAAGTQAAAANPAVIGLNTTSYVYQNFSYTLVPGTYPYYGCNITFQFHLSNPQSCGTPCKWNTQSTGAYAITPRSVGYFAYGGLPTALLPAQCNICVGDPVNPISGAVFTTKTDIEEQHNSPFFRGYYNSTNLSSGDLGVAWRHSFSRSINPKYSTVFYQPYSGIVSSLYGDAASACTSGFPQIKSRVSTWTTATASYANGVCSLSVGTAVIATLPIGYNVQPAPDSGTVIVGYDVTRDDGQLISFIVNGSTIAAPSGIAMQLQQTSSGFTLTDANDNVEQYDSNGKLLSITSRAGVVQTMSYDTSGRLSGVSDSFGHQLTLSYDSQGHLSSVTRQ